MTIPDHCSKPRRHRFKRSHSYRRKGNCCTGSQGLKKVETLIWLDVCWNTTTAVRSVWNNRSDCQRKKKAVWGSLKSLSLVFSGFIYIYFHGSVKYSIFLDQRVSNDLSFLWLLIFFSFPIAIWQSLFCMVNHFSPRLKILQHRP